MNDKEPRAVIVLGTPRSGTTVFGTFLETNPGFSYHGEVLNPQEIDSPQSYWNYCALRVAEDRRNILPERRTELFGEFIDFLAERTAKVPIADVKYFILFALEKSWKERAFPDLLFHLVSQNYRIFHVIRENTLRQIISLEMAEQTGKWSDPVSAGEVGAGANKIHVEPSRLLTKLESESRKVEVVRAWLRGYSNVREIFYDDMFEGGRFSPALVTEVARFLDCSPKFDPAPRLRRQNPAPLSELVENHVQLTHALRGTQYEWMLTDRDDLDEPSS